MADMPMGAGEGAKPMSRSTDHGTGVPRDAGIEPISVRVPEACRLTGIGRSKFYELVASGEIRVVKIGSMTLVPFEALRQFVLRRSAGPAEL